MSQTGKTLRLLFVEDSEVDAFFLQRELQRGGYSLASERVFTGEDFRKAIEEKEWDAVIADYSLPQFSVQEALGILHERGLDLPFIIVSGTVGEEVAVSAMKSGAHDYILKGRLARLVPAIEREIRDARSRQERRRAEEACLRLAAIVESSGDAIIGRMLDGTITSWNQGAAQIFGYSAEEVVGRSIQMLFPTDRMSEETRLVEQLKLGQQPVAYETVRVRKDGRRIDVSVTISPITDGNGKVVGASKIARDITERKRTENYVAALSHLGKNLSSTSTPIEAGKVIAKIAGDIFGWDAFALDLYSPEKDEVQTVLNVDTIEGQQKEVTSAFLDKSPSSLARRIIETGGELMLRQEGEKSNSGGIPFADTTRLSASLMFVPVRNENRAIGVLSIQSYTPNAYEPRDLGAFQTLADYCGGALERIRAREALRESEFRFRRVVESDLIGIFFWRLKGEIFEANEKFLNMTGYSREDLKVGRVDWRRMTPPEFAEADTEGLAEIMMVGSCKPIEKEYLCKNGKRIPVLIGAASLRMGEDGGVCFVVDVTERKHAEQEMRNSREELRALAANLQSIREEERKHITREIHDELGQSLTGFKMDLTWMRGRLLGKELMTDRHALVEKIGMMAELIDDTANLVRKLCTELRPGVLDDLGLIAAIEWQLREYELRTGIRCSRWINSPDVTVDAERSTALFRIFQEILTNVARHARASRVEVSMRQEECEIILEVKDNGRGIKESEKAGTKSLGLLGMRERALVIGGKVEIFGQPGKGTVVRVRVPRLQGKLIVQNQEEKGLQIAVGNLNQERIMSH